MDLEDAKTVEIGEKVVVNQNIQLPSYVAPGGFELLKKGQPTIVSSIISFKEQYSSLGLNLASSERLFTIDQKFKDEDSIGMIFFELEDSERIVPMDQVDIAISKGNNSDKNMLKKLNGLINKRFDFFDYLDVLISETLNDVKLADYINFLHTARNIIHIPSKEEFYSKIERLPNIPEIIKQYGFEKIYSETIKKDLLYKSFYQNTARFCESIDNMFSNKLTNYSDLVSVLESGIIDPCKMGFLCEDKSPMKKELGRHILRGYKSNN